VSYEWDPVKARANFKKHGIRFSDALGALEDDLAVTIRDPYCEAEERWITLGMDLLLRVVVVVFAWRGENIRVVSARLATPRERQQYSATGSPGDSTEWGKS
jgi:uncharacterized DUF497 family protein